MSKIRAGIDIGGAFTDLVTLDSNGRTQWAKVDSTPDLITGVINTFKISDVNLEDVTDIVHGHTVAINSLTTGKISKVGLITTKGFKDVLEIERANRRDVYNFRYHKPKPLVLRSLRCEVDERIDSKGKVIKALSTDGLDDVVRLFREKGVESVAVSLINSYVNEKHEVKVNDYIEGAGFGYVTPSHKISKIWREYERTSTAVLNSAILPIIDNYVAKLEEFLKGSGFKGNLYIMTSNGGHVTSSFTRSYPIFTLESGPVAGVVGAIRVAQAVTNSKKVSIITLDGGSTTTKSSLVQGGNPKIVTEYNVGDTTFWPGYPVDVPMVDITEVGIGGTSVVSFENGNLNVGPKAVGSYPGPACYNRGGDLPTLTDAYVVNGFIDPRSYLGGKIEIKKELASKAIEKIARKLKMTVNDAAEGIIRLANENAAYGIRLVSVQRGYDPRDFILVAFGGSGPMFAPFIAQELQTPILIPAVPLGNFSAWGMLNSNVRHDLAKTVLIRLTSDSGRAVDSEFKPLEDELNRIFLQEGKKSPHFAKYGDMRYVGQEHTIRVELPSGSAKGKTESIVKRFHRRNEQEYLFRMDSPVEIVNIHLVGYLPDTATDQSNFERWGGASGTKRKIYQKGRWNDATIYSRKDLKAGQHIRGLAIIEEEASTIVILENQVADVYPAGNIMIRRGSN